MLYIRWDKWNELFLVVFITLSIAFKLFIAKIYPNTRNIQNGGKYQICECIYSDRYFINDISLNKLKNIIRV